MEFDSKDPAAVLASLRDRHNTPPMPLRYHVEYIADVTLTARTTWIQQQADVVVEYGTVPTNAGVADEIVKTGNPVTDLRDALDAFATRLDEDGIIPLGITLVTDHSSTAMFSMDDRRRSAHVTVTVRGVRKAWVDEALAERGEA